MDVTNYRNLLFYVGEKFDSFEALTSKLEAYCKAAYVHYWTRDSRKIGCSRILRHIDEKLKYYSLKYTCVLGGQAFQSRGTGKRYSFSIRANNCPAHISVRASKDGMHLEVVSVNNDHNHDQSQEIFQALPQERRLPDRVKAEVLDLIKLEVDKKRIKEYVHLTTQKLLTTKDLTNIIAAGRQEKRPDITPERSEELLAKVYSNEVDDSLSTQHSRYEVICLKNEKHGPKAKRQCIPSYFLKSMRDTDSIRIKDTTVQDYAESEESSIPNSPLCGSYDLTTSTYITHAHDTPELPHSPSSTTTSSTPDVIVVEDTAHFCVTCGQALPDNHRLLQPILIPQSVNDNVFLSPIEQVGMVEEVVSSVGEIVQHEERHEYDIGRSLAVCSREGVVTVKEKDFEEFVQKSLQS